MTADDTLRIQGLLAEGAEMAAKSSLKASDSVSLTAGKLLDITDSGFIEVNQEGSLIELSSSQDMNLSGEMIANQSITAQAGSDVLLDGKLSAAELVSVASSKASISGTIDAEIKTTADEGLVKINAEDDLTLNQSYISSNTIELTAGQINNSQETLEANALIATASDGITVNTQVNEISANAGDGDLVLTNAQTVDLKELIANHMDISLQGNATLSHLAAKGNISLTTFKTDEQAGDIDIHHLKADGDISLSIQGDISQQTEPIVANLLDIYTAGAFNIKTQVNAISVETTGSGDVTISHSGGKALTLDRFRVNDGDITVTADATVNVNDVVVSNESFLQNDQWQDHKITIDTTSADEVTANIQINALGFGGYVQNDDGLSADRQRLIRKAMCCSMIRGM
jgi:hypothetical protein